MAIFQPFGVPRNELAAADPVLERLDRIINAVIDVENVVRRLRMNALLPQAERQPALSVVLAASREIRSSIVFATLVVALVFVVALAAGSLAATWLSPARATRGAPDALDREAATSE